MTLTKTSTRTSRRPCRKCGSTEYYWAREDVTGRFVMVDADEVTRAVAKDGVIPAGHAHACQGGRSHDESERNDVTTDETESKGETVTVTDEASKAPVTAAPSGDAFAAFQALIASMAPSVDAAQVREIVKDEIGGVVFPTRTVTVRESGERHEHEGLTHCQLADVIGILAAGEHVMMVGPAGTGKSTIAHQASEAIGLRYFAISVCPTTPESKIFGYNDANGVYHGTAFRDAFENGGVFNFDEIDNGHPSILAAINSALANGVCAFPDGMVKRSPEFRCVATANTYGRGADRKYVGRQSLDAATLDRFTMLHIDIDEALEQAICAGIADAATVSKVLGFVRPVRARADSQAMAVVVSPRASIGMCRLIGQGGFTFDRAVDMRVRRGLSDADWRKLSA